MSQHPHQHLALLVRPAPGSQRRAEEPRVPREPALGLPPLAMDTAMPRAPRLPAQPLSPTPSAETWPDWEQIGNSIGNVSPTWPLCENTKVATC